MNKYTILKLAQTISSWTFLISAVWISTTILFSTDCQRPALWAFFVSYSIDYALNLRWKDWHWAPDKWLYVAWIAYFTLIPLYHWLTNAQNSFIYTHLFNYSAPFLGVGIMGLMGINRQINLTHIAYAIILTAIGTIGYICLQIPYEQTHSLTDFMAHFADIRSSQITPHMMFNIYLNTGLVMGLYIARHKGLNKYVRIGAIPLTLIILASLLVSDGRVGFFTANAIIVLFLSVEFWNRWRKVFIPYIASIVILFITTVCAHPRMSAAANDSRQYIWEVSARTIAEAPILGRGIAISRSRFIENGVNDHDFVHFYQNHQLAITRGDFNTNMMHPHDTLLDAWMCFGFFGLLIMIFIIGYPFVLFIKQRNIYGIAFSFIFAMQAMFETWGKDLMPLHYTLGILWLYVGYQCYKSKTQNSTINTLNKGL